MKKDYEKDDESFPEDAYRVRGYSGVAFYVLGWEVEETVDTEWSGLKERTGRVLAVMIGDDYRHSVDVDDLEALSNKEYCRSCGQIGCTCNMYE